MKLRLNIPFTDLGYIVNVTCTIASIIFRKVIILLELIFKKIMYIARKGRSMQFNTKIIFLKYLAIQFLILLIVLKLL